MTNLTFKFSTNGREKTGDVDNITNILTSRGFEITDTEVVDIYRADFFDVTMKIKVLEFTLSSRSHKGGRPRKLSDEQITEIMDRLTDPNCNKSALAREYGVTYQTINKIMKKNYN